MPSLEHIVKAVSVAYGIPESRILSRDRTQPTAHARHAFIDLARNLTSHTLPSLGRWISRDHTSVLNSVRRSEQLRESDKAYRRAYQHAHAILYGIAPHAMTANLNHAPIRRV